MIYMQKLNALIKLGLALSLFAGIAHAQSANNGYPYSSLSGTPAAISVAPPYLQIGATKYITADNMFAATLPPVSPSYINTSFTGLTFTNATNGNDIFTTTGNGTFWFVTATFSSSVEEVHTLSALGGTAANAGYGAGPWVWDSTNHIVYSMAINWNADSATSTGCVTYLWKFSYSGSGIPTYNAPTALGGPGCAGAGSPEHLQITKSGSTITYWVSIDGGESYQSLGTQSVGTVTSGGFFFTDGGASKPGTYNLLSLKVQ
jgi:hypothetical protein